MEKYVDIIKKALELSETVLEGLDYIKVKLNESKPEETVIMLNDIITGIYSIQNSIEPIIKKLPENEIEVLTEKLIKSLDIIVSDYEESKGINAKKIIQFNLLPIYNKWKGELEKHLKLYVTS